MQPSSSKCLRSFYFHNIRHSKDEFPVLIKQSAELFQRVIAFSARFSDSELYTFLSSLYVSLSHYGLACCYFYLNQHQLARESYEKAILYILKFFSTSPPFDSSPPQIAVSSQNILISDAILCQQESQLNYSPFLLQYDNIFSIFSTSMMKIFEICLPDRSVTTSLTTLSFHYSILFDAYNWSLFFNFRAQKYADLVIICDNFYCSIDKCVETISSFPQTQQTKESWALLQQLSVGNFVIKCMAYDQLNCIDLDIQDQNYSQLYHHTEELSKYLSSTVPISVVGTFDSLTTWDCYHTFFLVTQYYFRRSKVLLFQLDDNILHNDNYELYDITQKVLEMSSRGIKEIEKYLRLLDIQLEKVTMESINFPSPSHDIGFSDRCLRLLFKYQDAYLHLLKLHLYRGLCAGDRIQGQRFFECGHGSREQYYR